MTEFAPAVAEQATAHYQVVDVLASVVPCANNGLASNQGTIMKLSWSEDGKPAGAQGYDVHRSRTAQTGTYAKINAETVAGCDYDDCGLTSGIYYYVVYLIDAGGQPRQWTPPFFGVIADQAQAETWMLYED